MPVYSQALTTENVLELVHFEDLPLGGEWRTRRRTITAADLAAFVGLSGDYNPLYTDAEHARGGHFGETVVPGALVVAVTTGLGAIDVPLPATVGMVGMTWKFLRPVRPGDTIRSLWRLNRMRPVENPRWGLAVWQVEVENQRGELVAAAELTRLVSRREQPAEAVRPGKAARRRRRRGAPEAGGVSGAVSELPPKPSPGPLREPLSRPVPEPAPAPAEPPWRGPAAEPEPAPAAEAPPEPAPGRRRRRSSSRTKPEPAPETAAAAIEAPAPQAAEEVQPAEEKAGEPKPAPRRRRRARQPEPAPEAPAPAAPEAPEAEPVRDRLAQPAPPPDPPAIPSPFRPPAAPLRDEPAPDGASGGLAGVLRRLRGT